MLNIREQEIKTEMRVTFSVDEFLAAAEAEFSDDELKQLRKELTKIIKNRSKEETCLIKPSG